MTIAKSKKVGRPALGTESDFRRFGGNPRVGLHGYEIYNSRDQLLLPITKKHIAKAKPRSPSQCAVGLAISDFFANKYEIEVGLTVVRVIDTKGKRLLRFHMPAALRKRLRMFDKNSVWDAPEGLYRLYPMRVKAKAKRPEHKKTIKVANRKGAESKSTTVLSVVGPRVTARRKKHIAAPTRFISRGKVLKRPSAGFVR